MPDFDRKSVPVSSSLTIQQCGTGGGSIDREEANLWQLNGVVDCGFVFTARLPGWSRRLRSNGRACVNVNLIAYCCTDQLAKISRYNKAHSFAARDQ